MNILDLPEEIQQRILILTGRTSKIELVCKKWYEFSQSKYIKKRRHICICKKKKKEKCLSIDHFCVCNLGLEKAMFCKSKYHPCICLKDINHAKLCNAKIHPCICEISNEYIQSCRSIYHPCICYMGKMSYCKSSYPHPCICKENPFSAIYCRGSYHPCIFDKIPNGCKSTKHKCICARRKFRYRACKIHT